METSDEAVIKLSRLRLPDAAKLLCRAFWSDPFIEYLFPDESERTILAEKYFLLNIRRKLMTCEVGVTSSLKGIVACHSYRGEKIKDEESASDPLRRMPYMIGDAPYERLVTAGKALEEERRRIMYMPHCYLYLLAVEPGQQGKGYGSLLIRPILEQADEKRLPCYLVTMRESNLLFYDKHGFKLIQAKQLPNEGPFTWSMLRKSVQ